MTNCYVVELTTLNYTIYNKNFIWPSRDPVQLLLLPYFLNGDQMGWPPTPITQF